MSNNLIKENKRLNNEIKELIAKRTEKYDYKIKKLELKLARNEKKIKENNESEFTSNIMAEIPSSKIKKKIKLIKYNIYKCFKKIIWYVKDTFDSSSDSDIEEGDERELYLIEVFQIEMESILEIKIIRKINEDDGWEKYEKLPNFIGHLSDLIHKTKNLHNSPKVIFGDNRSSRIKNGKINIDKEIISYIKYIFAMNDIDDTEQNMDDMMVIINIILTRCNRFEETLTLIFS